MSVSSLQFSLNSLGGKKPLIVSPFTLLFRRISPFPASSLGKRSRNLPPSPPTRCSRELHLSTSRPEILSTPPDTCLSPSSVDDALVGFIRGTRKATEVAHVVWQTIVRKGDVVVDATCGNGHDTLALLKIIADESGKGCVYGMDIQVSALGNTSSLLDESVTPKEKELVKLFHLCHSRMEDVIPKDSAVRLVAFNLGYLPGGDKAIITTSRTTLPALEAASRILESGGLLSTIVYVGHPGGREEFETVQHFASSLPVETWVCSKFEMLNRPKSPVLVLLFKK